MIYRPGRFSITVEVVPPADANPETLVHELKKLDRLSFDGFSVATNPVAKPRMSAMALSFLLQQKTGRNCILHLTTRDHNRISLQSELWGAFALGIDTVLAATGDFVSLKDRGRTTDVKDLDVFDLITMARESGMDTGAVLDFRPEHSGLEKEVKRLSEKAAAGAQFAVTQPVYDRETALRIKEALDDIDMPLIMGILPLRSPRHARFLHEKVAGIAVPDPVLERMDRTSDPVAEGAAVSREMLDTAKDLFSGACIMPPFDHFDILFDII